MGFITPEKLREEPEEKEFILLVGHPASGKSYACLTMAFLWQANHPDAKVFILDTERGIKKLIEHQFPALSNFLYWHITDAEEAIYAVREVKREVRPERNDLLIFESLSRNWDQAQDLASQVITGMPRSEWLSKWIRETKGKASPVPHPDIYWGIAKDAHVRNILDTFSNELKVRCNIVVTTTLPPGRSPLREKGLRAEIAREFLGIDISPDGAPRNPYYFDTVILLEKDHEGYWARILKDRGYNPPLERFRVNILYANLSEQRKKRWEVPVAKG